MARGRRDLAPARGRVSRPTLDTHCARQIFYYDRELRLRRHDYTAEVVGGWARAAHMCADHVEVGGLRVPDPAPGAAAGARQPAAPFPTLVALQLSEIEVAMNGSQAASSGTSPSRTTARRRAGRSPTRGSSTSAGRRSPAPTWRSRSGSPAAQHKTFPVLQLDGRNIGDSTAIIAALETRWPDAPLYPEDPAERRRALELEDHFDEQLGPQIRLLGWHELRKDPERMARRVARR